MRQCRLHLPLPLGKWVEMGGAGGGPVWHSRIVEWWVDTACLKCLNAQIKYASSPNCSEPKLRARPARLRRAPDVKGVNPLLTPSCPFRTTRVQILAAAAASAFNWTPRMAKRSWLAGAAGAAGHLRI